MKRNLIEKTLTLLLVFAFNFSSTFSQVNITTTGGVYPTGTAMMGITYGNGVYVAIGYTGYIVRSTDGINWTVAKNSTWLNATYQKVCYGNNLFVGISSGGHIVTSPDGTTWTQRSSGTTNGLADVQYCNDAFFAIGSNNTALRSPDGITWSAITTGANATDNLQNIFYANGKYYMGVRDNSTSNSRCYSSATGLSGSWSSVLITAGGSLNKLVYLNNRFYAFNSTPSVYSSTDGISWSAAGGSRLAAPNQIFHALYDGTSYYFFGTSVEHSYTSVFTSTDGTNFILQPQRVTLTIQHSAYLNGKYFIVGNEGIVSSTTGADWQFISSNLNGTATDGTKYVAVGQSTSSEGSIQVSTDFVNWTSAVPSLIRPLNAVCYGGGKFVAVGNTNALGFSTFATSTDGLTWTAGATTFADNLRSVAYGNGKYVAVGLSGRIAVSTTGTSWTSIESGGSYHYYGVSYINNLFVAVGGGTAAGTLVKVKYSVDGSAWTDASPAVVGHFHSCAYGGGKYMLVGRDNTTGQLKFFSMTTSDITSSSGYSAASTITTPEGDLGTLGYGSVVYANATFTAIANLKATPFSAYILTSTNASTWTATAVNSTTRLRSIINIGSSFRAVGSSPAAFLKVTIGATLPLKMLSFSGHERNSQVVLDWKVSNEANTDRFDVESSDDGQAFHPIGEVKAKNASGQNSYQFVDGSRRMGSRYYRLKMIDLDGKFIYSQSIRVEAKGDMKMISIFPNPAHDAITLNLPAPGGSTVAVFNNSGEKVMAQALQGSAAKIDITALKPGVYVVQVAQGDNTYSDKFIKK